MLSCQPVLSNAKLDAIVNFIKNWVFLAAPEKSFGPWKETWLTRLICILVLFSIMILMIVSKLGLYISVLYYWLLVILWWYVDEQGKPAIHYILLMFIWEDKQVEPNSNNTGLLILSLMPYMISILIISRFILNKIIYKNEKFVPLM